MFLQEHFCGLFEGEVAICGVKTFLQEHWTGFAHKFVCVHS